MQTSGGTASRHWLIYDTRRRRYWSGKGWVKKRASARRYTYREKENKYLPTISSRWEKV